jgi:hypothetical protein
VTVTVATHKPITLIAKSKPINGCYEEGCFCFFSILENKKYMVNQPLNAVLLQDAEKIVFMPRKLNTLILERLNGIVFIYA